MHGLKSEKESDRRVSKRGSAASRERRMGQVSTFPARLMAHVPFGLSVTDSEGAMVYVNPAFTALFGYGAEELQDRATWFEKAFPDQIGRAHV